MEKVNKRGGGGGGGPNKKGGEGGPKKNRKINKRGDYYLELKSNTAFIWTFRSIRIFDFRC